MAEYPQIGVRLNEELLKRIDDWRRQQDDLPGRPEAIRRLIELSLPVPAPQVRRGRKIHVPTADEQARPNPVIGRSPRRIRVGD